MKINILSFAFLAFVLSPIAPAAQMTNPQGTPPTFPQDQGKPDSTGPDRRLPSDPSSMPPDTKAPKPAAQDIQQQIEEKLAAEPELANSDIRVNVDKQTVKLTGTVNDPNQRTLALRIAQAYAADHKVIDKLKLRS